MKHVRIGIDIELTNCVYCAMSYVPALGYVLVRYRRFDEEQQKAGGTKITLKCLQPKIKQRAITGI